MRSLRFILLVCLLLSNFTWAMEPDTRCQNSYEECLGMLATLGFTLSEPATQFFCLRALGIKSLLAHTFIDSGLIGWNTYKINKKGTYTPCTFWGDHSCVCGLIKSMIVSKHQKEE